MTTFVNNDVASGAVVYASDHNTQGALLGAVLNGGIDSGNIATSGVGTTNIADGNVTEAKLTHRPSEYLFDHVASGCVWSGDSYASTRNASMTSGVVYIGGTRVIVGVVTARSFTASKDTYIDVSNAGTITYTEVANNAASPSLAANSIRLGIIVTGATTIAAVGSVNQGQEDKVLPIASSIAYAVTDSLGNLICPRDPNRRILGYRQVTANQSGIGAADLTGLVVPVLVPTGRKIKITGFGDFTNTNTSTFTELSIKEGATTLNKSNHAITGAGTHGTAFVQRPLTPTTSGLHTYKLSAAVFSGTGTLNAAADAPAFICVEIA